MKERSVSSDVVHVNLSFLKGWQVVETLSFHSEPGEMVWIGFEAFAAGEYMVLQLDVTGHGVIEETVAVINGGGTVGGGWLGVEARATTTAVRLLASGKGLVSRRVLHITDRVPTGPVGSIGA